MKHAESLALVWGEEPPIASIGYLTPSNRRDSGFTILYEDAPDPADVADLDDARLHWVCLHCLIEKHPEIGRGLDIARRHRVADRDDTGEWIAGT
ncbi:MAG: hypothetical protein K0T00_1359 [Gaiellaceae bacterium]|jgi:hypothetical protein|nr:hypothetical protein [Gaiellaceae bacterium]